MTSNLIFRLPFRSLVRKYDCDLAFTPMIISSSFVQSEKARQNEFSTNSGIIGTYHYLIGTSYEPFYLK